MRGFIALFVCIVAFSFVQPAKSMAMLEPTPEARPKFARGILNIKTIDGNLRQLQVEVARSEHEIAYGLMFQTDLPGTDGMLFMMPKTDKQIFWMKNTPMALDIVFLDEKGEVVDIVYKTEPMSTRQIASLKPASMVLEVKAGMAMQWGIDVSKATIIPPDTLTQ